MVRVSPGVSVGDDVTIVGLAGGSSATGGVPQPTATSSVAATPAHNPRPADIAAETRAGRQAV